MFSTVVAPIVSLLNSLMAPLLAIVDLIGFALAFLLHILADYVRRAAILKEEADATL